MVCFHPLNAYLPFTADEEGKRKLIFKGNYLDDRIRESNIIKKLWLPTNYYDKDNIILNNDFVNNGTVDGLIMRVPCGKCIGCKMDYARRWSVRCWNEAYSHDYFKNACFVTLTFNTNMLYKRSNPWEVDKQEFSSFMKRFRSRIKDTYHVDGVRFFACGEKGSKKGRPHYHLLLYGFNFPDKIVMTSSKGYPKKLNPYTLPDGTIVKYYHSNFLDSCWSPAGSDKPYGFTTISDISYNDCAYTARYILKKTDSKSGEFTLASRMPGIGFNWWKKYYKDCIATNMINLGNGRFSDIPRYYIDKLKEIDIDCYNAYKLRQNSSLFTNLYDETKNLSRERLLDKERYLKCKLKLYKRDYELQSVNEFDKQLLLNYDDIVKSETSELSYLQKELENQNLDKNIKTYDLDSCLHNI